MTENTMTASQQANGNKKRLMMMMARTDNIELLMVYTLVASTFPSLLCLVDEFMIFLICAIEV